MYDFKSDFEYRWSGSNRHIQRIRDFESRASANSATPAKYKYQNLIIKLEAATGFEPVIKVLQTCALPLGYAAERNNGAEDEVRTRDPHLGKVVFYH